MLLCFMTFTSHSSELSWKEKSRELFSEDQAVVEKLVHQLKNDTHFVSELHQALSDANLAPDNRSVLLKVLLKLNLKEFFREVLDSASSDNSGASDLFLLSLKDESNQNVLKDYFTRGAKGDLSKMSSSKKLVLLSAMSDLNLTNDVFDRYDFLNDESYEVRISFAQMLTSRGASYSQWEKILKANPYQLRLETVYKLKTDKKLALQDKNKLFKICASDSNEEVRKACNKN